LTGLSPNRYAAVAACVEHGAAVQAPTTAPSQTGASRQREESFNHFSLLRTVEDIFAVKHLGYAAAARVGALEPSLFLAKAQRK
jgi:hypothetical protein